VWSGAGRRKPNGSTKDWNTAIVTMNLARDVVVLFRRVDHIGDRLRGRGGDRFDLNVSPWRPCDMMVPACRPVT
jgi:hypothetical protein